MLPGLKNYRTITFFQKTAVFSFAIFVLAAWFSEGYHHPDEHFQILEFCHYKSGNIPSTVLPWEFNEQIRPALPIFIAYGIIQFFSFLGITDPFFWAFVLRLLVGLSAWWVMHKLALILLTDFKTQAGQKIFFAMVFLLWFVPFISARFSSENLASITVLYALFFLLTYRNFAKRKQFFRLLIIGLLLGFAFYFRFQVAFIIAGVGLWMLLIYKMKLNEFVLVITGSIIALLTCFVIDYWFYGNWVLTPANYFVVNILEDVVSNFGVSPWWNYIYLYVVKGFPPVSIPLLLFFLYGIYKNPRSIFLWCLVPFLMAHFMIGHKEIRFLFPVAFAFIYLSAKGIDNFIQSGKMPKIRQIGLGILLFINMPALFYQSFLPASDNISYYHFLYHFAEGKKLELFSFGTEHYSDAGLPIHFYRSPGITCRTVHDRATFIEYLDAVKPEQAYVCEYGPIRSIPYDGYTTQVLYSKLPEWVIKININNWVSRTSVFQLKKLVRI